MKFSTPHSPFPISNFLFLILHSLFSICFTSVYQAAFSAAQEVFAHTKSFPLEERYSQTDQIRRSSRSVCANIAKAWRKRRSEAFFVSTLNISEGEAAETQVWLQFAVDCKYLDSEQTRPLYAKYDEMLAQLVHWIENPSPWILHK